MTRTPPLADAGDRTGGRSFGARAWVRAVSTALRLALAVLWLVAGALKVGDAAGMVRTVRAFRILPESLVHPVAYAVPFVEIALGVLLLLGLAVRACALLSSLMLAAYIAAIASAAARGLRIECGCFSSGGDLAKDAPTHYTSELVRDSLLLVASGLLARWPGGYLALDRLLDAPAAGRRRPGAAEDEYEYDGEYDDETWDEHDEAWDDGDAAGGDWRGRVGDGGDTEGWDGPDRHPADGRAGSAGPRETRRGDGAGRRMGRDR
ncbi:MULTISPECIES: MauE/DoxX family redox-associated membrane protein [unclassified Pseudofrankia]|uniref:MauE/DoxX family redox-associated membrane protein n=1 Tax=unclassified Pseudofrankia TaxID=2994372 RepID=UPI0008D974CB|nr:MULTISPECIES: MauE/DoxX family redox-associated membrane protein [unclassified Pseudofrankia]MDT3443035.1 MauE/DoxX family redox-associated membrane protein [Pseudofrankia sp. BMG5.37]MDT3446974.1 MauE/DoxX family redox-associated membrane protein [Pseudofrankia sp. BMG5.37]OHV62224.1 hypothetical protein BCD48_39650 [Pseudofrankia sp. BMG5.36]